MRDRRDLQIRYSPRDYFDFDLDFPLVACFLPDFDWDLALGAFSSDFLPCFLPLAVLGSLSPKMRSHPLLNFLLVPV